MIAVDTNIIVRLLTGGHAEQTGWTRTLFEQASITLARTGLDFTDALHLSSCKGIETLITFDEHFVRLSNGIDGTRPKLP